MNKPDARQFVAQKPPFTRGQIKVTLPPGTLTSGGLNAIIDRATSTRTKKFSKIVKEKLKRNILQHFKSPTSQKTVFELGGQLYGGNSSTNTVKVGRGLLLIAQLQNLMILEDYVNRAGGNEGEWFDCGAWTPLSEFTTKTKAKEGQDPRIMIADGNLYKLLRDMNVYDFQFIAYQIPGVKWTGGDKYAGNLRDGSWSWGGATIPNRPLLPGYGGTNWTQAALQLMFEYALHPAEFARLIFNAAEAK